MIKFDNKIENVLAEYHQRIHEEEILVQSLSHEERNQRINEFLLPVGEEVGMFINNLAKSAKVKTILEIGTSYGYSTIWLA
jgi:predicted O-methyltransferase YrrM